MFGYIVVHKPELKVREYEAYRASYCGLCHSLKKRHGRLGQMTLSFDMTFLALLLTGLYEPETTIGCTRCLAHPLQKHHYRENPYFDYAADMNVMLTYYKCLDDWQDEHKHLQHRYAKKLEESYAQVKERRPRQCETLEKGIRELDKIEKSPGTLADEAANSFGRVMAELFVVEEDFWSNSLRNFGYHLGSFIYLMDATMDYGKDLKTGNYNPLRSMGKKPDEMENLLNMIIGDATREFEKLPLVQDAHLLRNILYGGVWQKYYAGKDRKERRTHD
jgi:hypothetical protein